RPELPGPGAWQGSLPAAGRSPPERHLAGATGRQLVRVPQAGPELLANHLLRRLNQEKSIPELPFVAKIPVRPLAESPVRVPCQGANSGPEIHEPSREAAGLHRLHTDSVLP